MIAQNQQFTNLVICLDGATFINCKFEGCRLTYSGILPVTLAQNEFNDCTWEFSGPAQNTIGFMTQLYTGGAKELIESTFKNIQEGAVDTRRSGDSKVSN